MNTIVTNRLTLRPFTVADAAEVAGLANDRDIALNTLLIPHPYAIEDALQWFERQEKARSSGEGAEFAITLRDDGAIAGAIGLSLSDGGRRAELGYWIGRPFWRRGFATEAARAMLRFGFETLGVERIFAYHFARNTPSRKVLENAGLQHEGVLRKHTSKWGEPQDLWVWGILRHEFDTSGAAAPER